MRQRLVECKDLTIFFQGILERRCQLVLVQFITDTHGLIYHLLPGINETFFFILGQLGPFVQQLVRETNWDTRLSVELQSLVMLTVSETEDEAVNEYAEVSNDINGFFLAALRAAAQALRLKATSPGQLSLHESANGVETHLERSPPVSRLFR